MKNKILSFLLIFGTPIFMAACSDFLDETPNKSGSAYVYHMDQLYGLMGSPELYLLDSPDRSFDYGFVQSYLTELNFLSDAIEYDPMLWFYSMNRFNQNLYAMYCLDKEEFLSSSTMEYTWKPSWDRIYTFNTVLENLDDVIQTTPEIRNQVEGEALFGRAYYHFLLLTAYTLWDEAAPGIGYRDNTKPNDVPARQTVAYTLGRIYDDLEKAETALRRAGRSEFQFEKNFRPTVPTVQAFRARVDLYRGNYESALKNANDALTAYDPLVTIPCNSLYALMPAMQYYLLDETDTRIEKAITANWMLQFYTRYAELVTTHAELFLPSMSSTTFRPVSESFYNLFDRENDSRWTCFYENYIPFQFMSGSVQAVEINGVITPNCIRWADQQWIKPANCHAYWYFNLNALGAGEILGMTTAEMRLIKAECLARSGDTNGAANVLKELRRTRFADAGIAENIGGTIQEVLDERLREMGSFWRVFDIKRLNGAHNAGITIRRSILTDYTDINSVTELVVTPDDGRWAMPIYPAELTLMGWEQNAGWE